jgi:hypothetical protein
MDLSFMSGSLVPWSSCLTHSSISLLCFSPPSATSSQVRLVGCRRGLAIVCEYKRFALVFHLNVISPSLVPCGSCVTFFLCFYRFCKPPRLVAHVGWDSGTCECELFALVLLFKIHVTFFGAL